VYHGRRLPAWVDGLVLLGEYGLLGPSMWLFSAFFGFAAFFTTACQNFTSISRFHSFTESVNCFTAALMRLKCTFHNLRFLTNPLILFRFIYGSHHAAEL